MTAKATMAPPGSGPPKQATAQSIGRISTASSGVKATAHKVVIYGPGGCGKSSLCEHISQLGIKPLFIDLDAESHYLDVDREEPESWSDALGVLRDQERLDEYGAVVVDSLTKGEELDVNWTLENVKHEKGHHVSSVEGYGYGKGFTHVYETFLQLLAALDNVVRSGKHVICTAHDCTANVPNPAGEDWIRYEPRLQSPASGKASIRHRVKEWCSHLLYIGFDTSVNSEGKATGVGTRTIYPTEMPAWWAKSRSLSEPIPYEKNSAELWRQLLKIKEK